MSAFSEKYGPWALVAGASVGLGAEFATQLAERGLNLILVARGEAALAALADSLRKRFSVEVVTSTMDLGRADLLPAIREVIGDREVGLLVYNAAYSLIGEFLDQDLDEKLKILDVNCRGPVILAHTLGRAMVERKRGGIILMASMAASQGSPMVATYAATKAFDLVLAEGLWEELGRRGVDVLACRAGATRTPAYEKSAPKTDAPMMDPPPVVASALSSLGKTPSAVPGALNKVITFVMGRFLSRKMTIKIMGGATRKMYG
jgi:short-subunit dehydrogenase